MDLVTFEGDPSVVDEHVQAPVLLFEEVSCGADAVGVINVQLMEKRCQPLLLQTVHRCGSSSDIPGCQVHVPGVLFAHCPHYCEPDAFICTSDQSYFAVAHCCNVSAVEKKVKKKVKIRAYPVT